MSPKPWYSNGLRFSCQSSGQCCRNHGDYGYVYLTDAELVALARYLELSVDECRARWCHLDEGWTVLRMDRPACPFLTEENRCGVYPVRPKQCATWPFWRENLDRETWEQTVKSLCPGVGRGRLYTQAEIERNAAENEANAAE